MYYSNANHILKLYIIFFIYEMYIYIVTCIIKFRIIYCFIKISIILIVNNNYQCIFTTKMYSAFYYLNINK